ncbi:uncharacterized protein LOC107620638 [Arachis ipaensis]|uniref:uncharacterized protein LOC107620638 n=1 Tax=Arachis ipaensis TaxID=130454 RepID=UPI0007AF5873|nr:uncharacterized protein LOC107620638 [Arachis ipaensis]XP_025685195.1 conglutin alpha 2-like [Arachis hypogaea]
MQEVERRCGAVRGRMHAGTARERERQRRSRRRRRVRGHGFRRGVRIEFGDGKGEEGREGDEEGEANVNGGRVEVGYGKGEEDGEGGRGGDDTVAERERGRIGVVVGREGSEEGQKERDEREERERYGDRMGAGVIVPNLTENSDDNSWISLSVADTQEEQFEG